MSLPALCGRGAGRGAGARGRAPREAGARRGGWRLWRAVRGGRGAWGCVRTHEDQLVVERVVPRLPHPVGVAPLPRRRRGVSQGRARRDVRRLLGRPEPPRPARTRSSTGPLQLRSSQKRTRQSSPAVTTRCCRFGLKSTSRAGIAWARSDPPARARDRRSTSCTLVPVTTATCGVAGGPGGSEGALPGGGQGVKRGGGGGCAGRAVFGSCGFQHPDTSGCVATLTSPAGTAPSPACERGGPGGGEGARGAGAAN